MHTNYCKYWRKYNNLSFHTPLFRALRMAGCALIPHHCSAMMQA